MASIVDGSEIQDLVDANRLYPQVLEEYSPGGVIRVSYAFGIDLISQNWSGVRSFFQVDGLGSTRTLTNAAGKLTDLYAYDAFGRTIRQSGNTENVHFFAGQERDSKVGLDYLRARYLNVEAGRFMSRDSLASVLIHPNSINKFIYASSNKVNFIDPTGHNAILYGEFLFHGVLKLETTHGDKWVQFGPKSLNFRDTFGILSPTIGRVQITTEPINVVPLIPVKFYKLSRDQGDAILKRAEEIKRLTNE